MSLPELAQSALDDEPVAARVGLGGEDELLVTPTRTLVYRSEGLLADESVREYPHDAERVSVAEGRRKSKILLDYGLDGEETLAVPTAALDEALHPLLAGVLSAAGITDAGETVTRTFRFSELTVVVTSARLVKHIGPDVWDRDFEEFHYDDVTDLAFEEGDVATAVVLAIGDRQERFKAPNEEARAVREALTEAVCAYHGADSLAALRGMREPTGGEAPAGGNVSFGEGPAPLSASPATDGDEPASEPANEPASEPEDEPADETGEELAAGTADGTAGEAAAETVDGTADGEAENGTTPSVETDGQRTGFEFGAEAAAESASGAGDGSDAVAVEGDDEVAAALADIRTAVAEQNERLARQEALLDRLVEELRRGR